jgi:hypothetical protein
MEFVLFVCVNTLNTILGIFTLTPWPESTSELCRQSDLHFSAKLVPTFADRGCHVVRVTDPYGRILGFLDRSRSFFLSSGSSIVLMRPGGPRSRPTIIW